MHIGLVVVESTDQMLISSVLNNRTFSLCCCFLSVNSPMPTNAETGQLQSNSHVTEICSRVLLQSARTLVQDSLWSGRYTLFC